METKIIGADEIDLCVQALKQGEVICFPTDTVYGVAAVVSSEANYQRLVSAKMRPESKPFSIMTASLSQIETLAVLGDRERALVEKWMPGGVTFIFNKREDVDDYVTHGLSTIGIRMPDDPWILSLIQQVGKPLFVPSANISGEPTATNFTDAYIQMNGRVSIIVEGVCAGGIASTIVDCTGPELKLLRAGAVEFNVILESVEGIK